MSELEEFLTARYDDCEQIALAAGGGHWQSGCGQATHDACGKMKVLPMSASPSALREGDCERITGPDMTIYAEGGHTPAQAAHITLNDPARVLREVEAGRKILAEVIPEIIRMDEVILEEWCSPDQPSQHLRLLRIMAAVFSDHPAYKPEWKL